VASGFPPVPLFSNVAVDVVALAASRGGIHALSQVLASLPADFPSAIVIVQHLDPHAPSLLSQVLKWATPLIVKQAKDGEQLQPSTVYVAPPDWHVLMTQNGTLTLSQSQPIQFSRPSADVLFHSIAENVGERAIAVILTGTGKDGAAGIEHVKQQGGITIAQDQATAEFFDMPNAAIATHAVDFVLPLDQIPVTLVKLVQSGL
jgi:two-component system, chemotaxis family, protein-glutamate methylesterase/glutaminase